MANTKCNRNKGTYVPFFFLSLFYYGFLSLLSHIPGKTISELNVTLWDKGIHFTAYAVLGVLLTIGIVRAFPKRRSLILAFSATGLIAILGALDEVHQLFVTGRTASLLDLLADTLGGMVGALAVVLFYPSAVLNHFKTSSAKIR